MSMYSQGQFGWDIKGNSQDKKSVIPTVFFLNLASNPQLMNEVDQFRHEFELLHGCTNPHRRYSTQLPTAQQQAMSVEKYHANMPPFARAFFEQRWKELGKAGRLDDVDDQIIEMLARRTRYCR